MRNGPLAWTWSLVLALCVAGGAAFETVLNFRVAAPSWASKGRRVWFGFSSRCRGQAYTYAYDRFGNRWQQNGPHSWQPGFDANNHMVPGLGVTYDAAGNETNDGTTAYTYDSENRIIAATNSGSGASSYLYDADGRRIRKASAATGTRDYLYDLSGHETTQVMSTGVWARGEVYVDGRHLATYVNATTYFNFSDWLGTERARALTGTSTACETMTSLPFGDGQTTAGSCGDPSFVHFTGKERDSESGLDNFGARYDSSQFGRFMTPDKFSIPLAQTSNPSLFEAILSEPQNWDQYSYAHNNPIIKTDLGGLLTIIVPGTHWSKKDWNTSSGFYKQVSATFHEQAVILDWSGGLSGKARSAGARQLNDLVKNHKFAAGEQLNIVAHSNGGNVAFEASQTVPHKIDNLVTLGTPIRGDIQPDMNNISNELNVYSLSDGVQTSGGGMSVYAAGRTLPDEDGVTNVEAPEAQSHSDLWQNPDVWQNQVSPNITEESNRECGLGNGAACNK